jgi:hypothetical protein
MSSASPSRLNRPRHHARSMRVPNIYGPRRDAQSRAFVLCALAMGTLVACSPLPPRPPSPSPAVGAERASCGMSDRLCLTFLDEMSPEFEAVRLLIVLDGAVVFDRHGSLASRQFVYYSGPATAGSHLVETVLHKQRGRFHFEARCSHTIEVAADGPRPDRLITVAYEKPSQLLEERPQVRFIEVRATQPQAQHAMTIWVSKDGEIELDGKQTDVEAVGRALESLSKSSGTIVYGVESSQAPAHANVQRIFEWIVRTGLVVRLSVQRDFSDIVKKNATPK